jgi:small-conductance mechanosensitive channel
MFSMRESLVSSLKGAFAASSKAVHETEPVDRTEQDIPPKWVLIAILLLLVPVGAIYYYFTRGVVAAIVATVVMSVTGFLLSAIADANRGRNVLAVRYLVGDFRWRSDEVGGGSFVGEVCAGAKSDCGGAGNVAGVGIDRG